MDELEQKGLCSEAVRVGAEFTEQGQETRVYTYKEVRVSAVSLNIAGLKPKVFIYIFDLLGILYETGIRDEESKVTKQSYIRI